MNYKEQYLHCGEYLIESLSTEINEVSEIVKGVQWHKDYSIINDGKEYKNQSAYNKTFDIRFKALGWELRPLLKDSPRLIGDFRKNLAFVEVQFGNSSTLARQAKLGASCGVQVPVGKGLATHPYRVLRLWRSSGRSGANKTGEAYTENHAGRREARAS